jgi:cell division protein FtsB
VKWLSGALLVLFLILQYQLWVSDNGIPNVRRLQKELAEQRAINERLEARNRALQAEVEDLKKGLAAVEELAREDLGMIKEGETFFRIVEPTTPPASENAH